MARYRNVQFIACPLATLRPWHPPAAPPTPDEPDDALTRALLWADGELALCEDLRDARARVRHMRQVVELIRRECGVHIAGADTLKLFVMPEFYFRCIPQHGDSPLDSYRHQSVVNNLFASLLETFRHADYEDWLFVPGTIFWSQRDPQPVYFNTVSVVRGRAADFPSGDALPPSGVMRVTNGTTNQKQMMSHIDLRGRPDPASLAADAAIHPHFAPVFGDWAWRKAHLFSVGDIEGPHGKPLVFGLEVCLEHVQYGAEPSARGGTLRHLLGQWPAQQHGAQPPEIDVQILTSCGMTLQPESVCAKAGGYALACDGAGRDYSAFRAVIAPGQLAAEPAPVFECSFAWDAAAVPARADPVRIYPAQPLG